MTGNQLFIDTQKAFGLVTRKVFYNILIVFGVSSSVPAEHQNWSSVVFSIN
jgi:hypothetical protein